MSMFVFVDAMNRGSLMIVAGAGALALTETYWTSDGTVAVLSLYPLNRSMLDHFGVASRIAGADPAAVIVNRLAAPADISNLWDLSMLPTTVTFETAATLVTAAIQKPPLS